MKPALICLLVLAFGLLARADDTPNPNPPAAPVNPFNQYLPSDDPHDCEL